MATPDELFKIVKEKFPEGILEEHLQVPDPFLVFDPALVEPLCLFCRDDPRLHFDLLSLISTVDYLPQAASPDGPKLPPPSPQGDAGPARPGWIEVVYILDSTVHKHRLLAKTRLDRENPHLATVENVWRAADWHEREAFDLMGVVFEGHHHLVRILCAEDWEGHPLRKDYVIPETYHGIKNVIY